LVSAIINAATVIATFYFLPETLPRIVKQKEREKREAAKNKDRPRIRYGAKKASYNKLANDDNDDENAIELEDTVTSNSMLDLDGDNHKKDEQTDLDLDTDNEEKGNTDSLNVNLEEGKKVNGSENSSGKEEDENKAPNFRQYMWNFLDVLKGREVCPSLPFQ